MSRDNINPDHSHQIINNKKQQNTLDVLDETCGQMNIQNETTQTNSSNYHQQRMFDYMPTNAHLPCKCWPSSVKVIATRGKVKLDVVEVIQGTDEGG